MRENHAFCHEDRVRPTLCAVKNRIQIEITNSYEISTVQ